MPTQTTVLTAIPYVNSTPHIGNVLTTLSGDVTARYLRMRGHDVWFQVGTDENGLKIKEAAENAGEPVQPFVDRIAKRFADIFDGLKIQSDDFVRTTEQRHIKATQALFAKLQENGHIYQGVYEGWYDVSTETFFREEDLVEGKSPDGNEVRWVSETNYFFRLSSFQAALEEAYAQGAIRVVPETRQNEVLSFIRQGLRDVCVSRSNPGWGIPVPGDESQVVYVWFDALINYLTTTGWPEAPHWREKWPPVVQWLGKDILTRFHATLWPAMLLGAGFELPQVVVGHAWILLGQEKISKSKGNVVEPLVLAGELAERAGIPQTVAVDALRIYLVSTMGFENDTTFTYEEFDRRYNSDLANDLGNALNRSLSMAHKFLGEGATVPDSPIDPEALAAAASAKAGCERAMEDYRLDRYCDSAWSLVRYLNKAIDSWAPWQLAKTSDPKLASVLRSMLFCLRTTEGFVRPLAPDVADEMASQLGLAPLTEWELVASPDCLPPGTAIGQPRPIFPRLEAKASTPPTPMETQEKPTETSPVLEFADFAKVNLRVARVIEAEPIEKSEKLLKLQVMIGEEKRQIIAGIAKSYAPVDLIGRQIVVVVNLKPAKLMGHESQGMVLAADDADGTAILLQPERESPEGASVH
jgi:methionyl-tRNA synthetase